MIITKNNNIYSDGAKEIVLHKSELVEMIAGLHSLQIGNDEKLHSLRVFDAKFKELDETVKYSLKKYGEAYADWLLIMDIATYLSCEYYEATGETYLSFETAMEEYDKLDIITYMYIFLGMPALGYEKEDAERWINDTDSMSSRDVKTIGQYISQKNVKIFIRNIRELKDDLRDLLKIYWSEVFKEVWENIQISIDKTIDSAGYECRMLGDVSRYVANIHKDIKVSKGNIYIQKDVPYVIELDKIEKVHIFPSTFSGEELLIDIFGQSLVIYYNLNLRDLKQIGAEGKNLCRIFKILGDDTRLKIAKLLWGAPATTQYLSGMLGMSPSTVSAHLKVMKDEGLLTNKSIKKFVYYEINQEALTEIGNRLTDYLSK